MKQLIVLIIVIISSSANAQWVVNDPMNYVPNIKTYLETIKQSQQMLEDFKEFTQQTKMLESAFDEGGLWDETFKALANIREYLEEAHEVISAVHARDIYALIPHLPLDDDWKENIYTVINDAHGLISDEHFDRMVDIVSDKNPILSDFLIQSRFQGRAGLDHRLNSYYFVSARKDPYQKRMDLLQKHRAQISTFQDRSQGESMNMMNSQLLLIAQQNEELIKAIEHQITASQNDYLDRQKAKDDVSMILINQEIQRRSLDFNNFKPQRSDW